MLESPRTSAAASFVLAAVVSAAVATGTYRSRYDDELRDTCLRTAVTGKHVELAVGALDMALDRVHGILAAGPGLAVGEERGALTDALDGIRTSFPDLRTMLVLDAQGIVRADMRPDRPGLGMDVSDREYFRAHAGSGDISPPPRIHLGDILESRVDGAKTFPLSTAVRDEAADGALRAVVVTTVEPSYFASLRAEGFLPSETEVLLAAPEAGRMTALAPDEPAGRRTADPRAVLAALRPTDLGVTQGVVDDAQYAAYPLRSVPLSLVTRRPLSAVRARAWGAAAPWLAAGLGAGVLLAAIVGFRARRRALDARHNATVLRLKERLALANRTAGIGVWDLDLRTGAVEWDDVLYAVFGVDRAEFGGRYEDWADALHPDDRERAESEVRTAIDTGRDLDSTIRIVRPDGEVRTIKSSATVVRGPDGSPERMVGIGYDVTRLLDAERAARDNEELFRDFAAASAQRFWELDRDLRFTMVRTPTSAARSDAEPTLLGRTPWEAAGADPDSHPSWGRHRDELRAHRPFRDFVFPTTHGEATRWIRVSGQPRFDGDGAFVGYRGSAADITAQKELEEQLEHAQRMEAIGQLTAGVAHDFNNILTVVRGNAELLRASTDLGADDRPVLEEIDTAVERAASLTEQLLAFGRKQPLRARATDVARLLGELEKLMRRTIGPSIEIAVRADDGVWPAFVDPHRLEDAVLNLALNARDALLTADGNPRVPGGAPPRLTIEARNRPGTAAAAERNDGAPAGDLVELVVRDNGIGMTREVRERAAEPFFTTKDLGAGSGLGLSMVYGFALQSCGRLGIRSEPGRGTAVTLLLPRAQVAPDEEPPTAAAPDTAAAGLRILLVEDEEPVRDLVARALRGAGHVVTDVEDGARALEVFEVGAFDAVVTDYMLPGGLHGPEVVRSLREREPGLRAVLVTGYAANLADARTRAAYADIVLGKPFRMHELLEALAPRAAGRTSGPR